MIANNLLLGIELCYMQQRNVFQHWALYNQVKVTYTYRKFNSDANDELRVKFFGFIIKCLRHREASEPFSKPFQT